MNKASIKSLLFLVTLLFMISCNKKVNEKDLVGIWEAKDGATIELKPDKSFSGSNIDFGKIEFPEKEFANKKVTFDGNWKLTEYSKSIELVSGSTYADYGIENTYLDNGIKKSHRLGFSFIIEGSGLLQNSPPWKLVVYIGDPDEMNKYEFMKKDKVYR